MSRFRLLTCASVVWLFVGTLHHGTLSPTSHSVLRHEKWASNFSLPQKNTTVLLYVAARNNLLTFIDHNLAQLMRIGTNEHITFLVYLNVVDQHGRQITQRLIIYKNKIIQLGEDSAFDSGSPATLIDACTWAFGQFPAKNTVLILWNHGTGGVEPFYNRAINTSNLYTYNPETRLIEINRSIGFLEYLALYDNPGLRGICFDDSTRNYLTNHQVGQALRTVQHTVLKGKPFDVICCDACLMQCIEFAYSLKPRGEEPVARYMVGSQEVVLAKGYPYFEIFLKPATNPLAPRELAEHIVQEFVKAYQHITRYCTHAAVDLSQLDALYTAVDTVAQLLIEGLLQQQHNSVRDFIAFCSSKERCTYFVEPTYKDVHHLFSNMLKHLAMINLTTQQATMALQKRLHEQLLLACKLIKQATVANAASTVLSQASGLSIYLPLDGVHPSYAKTDWGLHSKWTELLQRITRK
jgi:hypothetical protein